MARAINHLYIDRMEEKRLIDLESKLAHQEILLEELHQVIYRQQQSIDGLETKLTILIQRLRDSSSGSADIGPGNEKPPHY